jgi:hypothetical protein
MNVEQELFTRSGSVCELCAGKEQLTVYDVLPSLPGVVSSVLICSVCTEQITGARPLDTNHWRCLNNARDVECQTRCAGGSVAIVEQAARVKDGRRICLT